MSDPSAADIVAESPLPPSQRVPRELIAQIVELIRPVFDICSPSILGASVFSSRQNDFAVYLADMKDFLALRLISRIWNAVMIPLIYKEFVIPTRFPVTRPVGYGQVPCLLPTLINSRITNPYGRVHKLVTFLRDDEGLVDNLVENMKTLILYDFCHPFSSNEYADETRLMTKIIQKFQNSDIRTLHCYGRETYAFRHSGWLEETLPNLLSTIESLSFDAVDRRAISSALGGLGGTIRFLEIRNRSRLWDVDYESLAEATFTLPDEMPKLETLRLIHISTTLAEFLKLLSCVGAKRRVPARGKTADALGSEGHLVSSLRSLTVTQLFVLNEDPQVGGFYSPLTAVEFSGMLDINGIADNLTYLYIGPGLYSMSDAFNVIWPPEVVTEIVKKCRRLITFCYTSIIDESLVDNLPTSLCHLSLALRPSLSPPSHVLSYLDSLPMFTDMIQKAVGRGQRLEKLTILVMDQLQRNPGFWRMSFEEVRDLLRKGRADLESTCADAGIELCFDLI